ncbi:hypothetical protein [Parvularcula marina]|uniref:hypothetical protein n=1 Tax=Parvularcula marina TaxID=2292771 RepID=UPI003512FD40
MGLWIIAILSLTASDPTASGSSTAACSSLKNFAYVAQHAQTATNSADASGFRQEMAIISEGLDGVSLFDMIPQTESTTFRSERREMLIYLATMREAAREFQAGRLDYARQLVTTSNQGTAIRSSQTVLDFWGCENDSGKVQEEEERPYPDLYDGGVPLASAKDAGPGKAAPFGVQYETDSDSHDSATSGGGDSSSGGFSSMTAEEARKTRNKMLIGLIICAIIGTISVRRSMRSRKAVRQMCFINIKIKHEKDYYRALMLDVGIAGSKICHKAEMEKNDRLDVLLCGKWLKARVRWSNGGYSGISFLHPLSTHQLAEVLLESDELKSPQSDGSAASAA